jgi:3-deoxy-D-manno-octulosonic-acid transferase
MAGFLLALYLTVLAPKLLYDLLFKGKKHPGFKQRLGFSLPDPHSKPVLWLHAVSVGEVKALQPLFRKLRQKYPEAFFLVTTTTGTGQAEAKRSLSEANAFTYLPLDFKWVIRRFIRHFHPYLFVLIESDFWPNLLATLKKTGCRNILVSGKLSERSARRFQTLSYFSKKLFSCFDLLCVQNQEHFERFRPLVPDPARLHITGNLKLDIEPQPVDLSLWQNRLRLSTPAITISCTHAPEEALLLDALSATPYLIFLVPRHPERFEEVAELLRKRQIPFARWSQLDRRGGERVVLVDAMGQLPICYSLSRLAILGGSYIDSIGGHNILEPSLYGTPAFFGPHTFGQREFVARSLESGAGRQIPLSDLGASVQNFFTHPLTESTMRSAAKQLIEGSRGATARTLNLFV